MSSSKFVMHDAPWTLAEVPFVLWESIKLPTLTAIGLYAGFLVWIALLTKYLPGPDVQGQPVPGTKNLRLWYRLNGLRMALLTWSAYLIASYGLNLFPATIVYDNMAPLASTVFLFVFFLSLYLYLSARISGRGTPSGAGITNVIYDFWTGIELNPNAFGMELKWYALKVALIGWIVMNFSFAAEQYRIHGMIGNRMFFYQLFSFIYAFDYYWNERAMLSTWDIIAEHYGFMLVFGNFWFMWFAFCVQGWYLINDLEPISATLQILMVGFFCLGYWIFRSSNSQKNQFKLDPTKPIWGEKPKTIGNGRILISGWWGILRKANYLGDWIIAIALSLPCGFTHVFAHFYPIYLIILGTHRAIRDDIKCSAKYKEVWVEYKKEVRWMVIPYLF